MESVVTKSQIIAIQSMTAMVILMLLFFMSAYILMVIRRNREY